MRKRTCLILTLLFFIISFTTLVSMSIKVYKMNESSYDTNDFVKPQLGAKKYDAKSIDNSPAILGENEIKRKDFIQACQAVMEMSRLVVNEINKIQKEAAKNKYSALSEIKGLDNLKDVFERDISLMKVKLKRLSTTKFEKIDNDLFSEQFYFELRNRYYTAILVEQLLYNLHKKIVNIKQARLIKPRVFIQPFFYP
ncbi:hypothetical protein A2999_02750 [Candidatus Wolfebacteria bacterium RIFCSPLOWO2_01_FULL_38_11]|uniref:Uncharacterized protein n=1 Tax=Candidatus Wolfebacteria bacterium RIFCSPLOWO2_01_FULL_38_11 TaxID=1802556 RepID=A0A1F8DRX5_9BACT|nr:MAG: hypothetical protein A2999_02750 [Candidatus Wolfebacteria bacterium RIFCSPLOWO2_01_FULL_38_11]